MRNQILLIILIAVIAVSGCVSQTDTSPIGSTTPRPEILTGQDSAPIHTPEKEGQPCDPTTEKSLEICEGNVGVGYGCVPDYTECNRLGDEYLDSFGTCGEEETACEAACGSTGCLDNPTKCADAYVECRRPSLEASENCKPTGTWYVPGALSYCDTIGKNCVVAFDQYTKREIASCK